MKKAIDTQGLYSMNDRSIDDRPGNDNLALMVAGGLIVSVIILSKFTFWAAAMVLKLF